MNDKQDRARSTIKSLSIDHSTLLMIDPYQHGPKPSLAQDKQPKPLDSLLPLTSFASTDPLTALGVANGVVTFVDFASKLITTGNEIY